MDKDNEKKFDDFWQNRISHKRGSGSKAEGDVKSDKKRIHISFDFDCN